MGLRLCLAYFFGVLSIGAAFSAGVGIFFVGHALYCILAAIAFMSITVTLARAEGRNRRY